MNASTTRATKYLWLAAIIGCIFAVSSVIAYLKLGPKYQSLLMEGFKTSLAFTFTAVGGTIVKVVLDAEAKRQAELTAESNAWDERRRTLIRDLTEVFSGFYAVRKHYHSVLDTKNADAIRAVRESLLREAVELEGRYGGLKPQAFIHLNLPVGDLEHKNLDVLEEEIENQKNPNEQARLWFDFLGEAFDGWRHALESGEKIKTVKDAWTGYARILALLWRKETDLDGTRADSSLAKAQRESVSDLLPEKSCDDSSRNGWLRQ